MAKTNWQDPKTSEMRSTHVAGLMEAVGKIEDSIGMESVFETNIPLTEVFISSDDRYRIFQAPEGKRNWTAEQAPVIKRNGVTISSGFEIDYGGGAIILNVNDTVENTYTADVKYTKTTEIDVSADINAHNTSGTAHDDIRESINDLDANKVDNSRVLTDVPLNAKFTDTVTTINGKTGAITKADIVALGIPAQDTNTTYSEISTSEIDAGTSSTLRTITGRRVKYILDKVQGWIGSLSHSKTARFIIGTSTSGWTAADCDYLCDGTADQTEINAAITALPATGGEIVILDGTYNITAKINVTKDNVSIRGNGNATILKRMFNSSTAEGVITLTNRSGCKIANLQIDGNGAEYTDSNNSGIYLSNSSNNTITGNTCNNNSSHSIYLTSSSNNTITGNACNNNSSNNGILLNVSSNNTVTGNTCNNNGVGIYLSSSSNNNTVTGNTYNNNNYGIYLRSSNNTVTGNACNNNNNSGIYLLDSSNNTVTSNTCIRGTGLAGDYTTSQHTIQLKGTGNSYNLIAMNNCMGKAVTVEGGTGNTLVNNKFDAT